VMLSFVWAATRLAPRLFRERPLSVAAAGAATR
jgi:hypothetical protein